MKYTQVAGMYCIMAKNHTLIRLVVQGRFVNQPYTKQKMLLST